MPISCPACGKTGQSGDSCQRCQCSLATLRRIAQTATAHLLHGTRQFKSGNWTDALRQAERSWRLMHTREAADLGRSAAGAAGDTRRYVRWHARLQ